MWSWQACASVLVLISAFYAVNGYQNDWDGNLHVDCHDKKALYGVESVHNNYREDRRFLFMCQNVVKYDFSHCYWTGYENEWDLPLLFMCPANYVMAGVSSHHDNHREDRRWRFKCCTAKLYKTRNCHVTDFINKWDAPMNHHSSGSTEVFAGALSYHDNHREDRRWKLIECDYTVTRKSSRGYQ